MNPRQAPLVKKKWLKSRSCKKRVKKKKKQEKQYSFCIACNIESYRSLLVAYWQQPTPLKTRCRYFDTRERRCELHADHKPTAVQVKLAKVRIQIQSRIETHKGQ
jgi:hypothetical protein